MLINPLLGSNPKLIAMTPTSPTTCYPGSPPQKCNPSTPPPEEEKLDSGSGEVTDLDHEDLLIEKLLLNGASDEVILDGYVAIFRTCLY